MRIPVPSAPQPAELPDQGVPAADHVHGSVWRTTSSPGTATGWTLLADFNQPNNTKAGFSGGAEWMSKNLGGSAFGVALRGSYTYFPSNNLDPSTITTALNDEENLEGLAAGGGLFYAMGNFNLGVDYAYRYLGVLGPTHFISFGLGW